MKGKTDSNFDSPGPGSYCPEKNIYNPGEILGGFGPNDIALGYRYRNFPSKNFSVFKKAKFSFWKSC